MDRETYLSRVGEDIEPGGRDPAPSPLRVVQKFVNTYNHELGHERDRLGTPAAARRWLIENSLIGGRQRLSLEDTRRLHRLREVIRALAAGSPKAEDPAPSGLIDHVGVDVRLRVRTGEDARVHLEPAGAGVERVIGALLAIVHDAMVEGSWPRMKVCRQCAWLFFDHSRNRSGGWCSMAVCGNRSKNRSFRRRRGQY